VSSEELIQEEREGIISEPSGTDRLSLGPKKAYELAVVLAYQTGVEPEAA
jgi:hypothetical protein